MIINQFSVFTCFFVGAFQCVQINFKPNFKTAIQCPGSNYDTLIERVKKKYNLKQLKDCTTLYSSLHNKKYASLNNMLLSFYSRDFCSIHILKAFPRVKLAFLSQRKTKKYTWYILNGKH